MKKHLLFLVLNFAVLAACAPESNTLKTINNPQVNQQAVDNLTSKKWCQRNKTTGANEFKWQFNKDFTATSVDLRTQQPPEPYQWSITGENTLNLTPGMLTVIFIKTVTYNFDIATQKRTMQWTDGPEITNFIECE